MRELQSGVISSEKPSEEVAIDPGDHSRITGNSETKPRGWKPCSFGPLKSGHPEWDESMVWKRSIGEVFGTLGYPRETLASTVQVNAL